MRHDPTFWLLARASGITAYVMLTLSVLAGLVLKSRPFSSLRPAAVTDLHRALAMLGRGALAGRDLRHGPPRCHRAVLFEDRLSVARPGPFIAMLDQQPTRLALGTSRRGAP